MSAPIPSPDGAVENDRHHHHDRHPVEMAGEAVIVDDVSGEPSPTPDADPIAVIEAALVRLVDDVGVLAEEDVVRAFAILKATDLPSYLRLRHAAKKTNRDCSVTVLDKLVRDELPGSDDDASALDELVALARAQCQLHHDADRNAVLDIARQALAPFQTPTAQTSDVESSPKPKSEPSPPAKDKDSA